MSITKRILDLAKANLNALLDRAQGETSVDELTDEELRAELERREERRRREEAERKDRQGAERAARERAAKLKNAPPSAPPNAAGPQKTKAKPRPRPASAGTSDERRLRELYAQLEVPYGAGFEEVKKSFRRLMRKYHPDLHAGNPTKHKAATQLTMSLTEAYDALEKHLSDKRR